MIPDMVLVPGERLVVVDGQHQVTAIFGFYRSVPCPSCPAAMGEDCVNSEGERALFIHEERFYLAREVMVP